VHSQIGYQLLTLWLGPLGLQRKVEVEVGNMHSFLFGKTKTSGRFAVMSAQCPHDFLVAR
jgi:hypothetical protein